MKIIIALSLLPLVFVIFGFVSCAAHKTKKIISTDKAPAAIGPYSQAVMVGDTLYLSGQIPIDPATGNLIKDDIEKETKQVLENIGAVLKAAEMDFDDVTYPVIVKPRMEAVSFGLRIVHSKDDLKEAVEIITKEFEQQALVEKFISGREFAVALLGNKTALETLPIVEIDLGGNPEAIQTVEDKMQHPLGKICPAQINEEKEKGSIDSFFALE